MCVCVCVCVCVILYFGGVILQQKIRHNISLICLTCHIQTLSGIIYSSSGKGDSKKSRVSMSIKKLHDKRLPIR